MLFTRCPSCETTFRITDQALHKAGGQVRCGRCSCVFDAYSALREQRDDGEVEGDAGLGTKAGAAGGGSAGSASASENAMLLEQDSEHEESFEAAAGSSRIEQVAQPIGAAAASIPAAASITKDTDDAPAKAAEDDGRANAAPIADNAAVVLEADAFGASEPDSFGASEPDAFTTTPEGNVHTASKLDEFAALETDTSAASESDTSTPPAPDTFTAMPEADAAEPTPPAALDPDEEWLATAALFIVQSAAEPSPTAPSPEPTRRTGDASRTGAGRRAGTKRKAPPDKAKPQSEPSPADDVLDDYSVAAVLEQIESSSLPADAERLEDESVDHEPAVRGPLEHASPEHDPPETEAAAAAPGPGDSARVLAFDANDSRGGTALGRDVRRGPDSTHGTPSAPSVPAAHALPHAVRAAKASAAIGAATNLGNTSTARGANAAPANAAASDGGASSTPPHTARSALAAAPPFVKPPQRTRAAVNSAWLVASIGAILLLGAQLTNHFRADLVGIDGIGPALRNLYARIGIELIPRWDLDQYRIVDWVATAEPNAKGRGSLRITAQIRNEGRRAQPFPYVHLQLKDRWEKSVASRMFRPSEYLSESTRAEQLMPAGATARAELEVIDPGPDAYGFELDVCIERPDRSVHCAADDVFR